MADSYSRLANSTRQVTILKILFVILSVLFVALIITLTVVLTSKRAKDSLNDRSLKFCPENTKLTVSTARSHGLYDDLSEKEIISMRDFILSQTSLNITPLKDATSTTITSTWSSYSNQTKTRLLNSLTTTTLNQNGLLVLLSFPEEN